MNKKIIFACTSGIATSAVATEKVVTYCKEQGINVEPIQSNIGTISSQDGMADLIIVTSAVKTTLQTPVLNGLPLLTGFGEEDLLEKIVALLKK
ncbi:PTS system galactitol-specific IIB component [Pantoea agglomerans]|uniref:PTS sugar transporter subunit IIB n=1 Tax=Enterobacter agglomerans TaxID=549 RepID=UPI0015F9D582|nr:PTS sugar transporter subunit IIB [Pantoea agglomerans]MBA8867095.1 PTS system galactitol-specific IIB component [Pantoea agglomerans]MBA8894147.1 PTS system galactitol-specific IIB component [Pantoea agglomerans]